MELAGAAISALANLAIGRGHDHAKFTTFVETYLPAFRDLGTPLDDISQGRENQRAITPADHFYKFFRSSLAHTFCIDWGGIQHREELPTLGPEYLFSTTQGPHGEHGLGIIPREFVQDFERACDQVLTTLADAPPGSEIHDSFERTFDRVFLRKIGAPMP